MKNTEEEVSKYEVLELVNNIQIQNIKLNHEKEILKLLNNLDKETKNKINISDKKRALVNLITKQKQLTKDSIPFIIQGLFQEDKKAEQALNDENCLKKFTKEEIKNIYEKEIEQYKTILKSLLDDIDKLEKSKTYLKSKQKLQRTKKPKMKDNASCPTSLISYELTKNHNSCSIENDKFIKSEPIETKSGYLEITKEMEKKLGIMENESEVLKNHKKLGFTREELQIYLGVLNVYIQNVAKFKYGIPYTIEIPWFHKNILKRTGHLQKRDFNKYESIFMSLATKRIKYSTTGATISPYKKKNMRDIRINSSLINIDIITDTKYKHQLIKITPSEYTLLELKNIKQISNYLPWEFIQLDFDKSDNIFYFGLYLVRMHRNNDSHSVGKERIKNVTYAWEVELQTIVEKALPNGKHLIEEYNNLKTHKKQWFVRNIEEPLLKAINIFENCNYFVKSNKKRYLYKKDAFSENKIKIIFNYDNGKLIKTKKFQNDKN